MSRRLLTDTTARNDFAISRPNGNDITFSFRTDASRPGVTRITLPEGSTWAPSPHWHERYAEYVQVIRGRIIVVLDGRSKVVAAEDGPQVVDKFVVHDWMRADRDSVVKDEGEVIVEEWTDPADGSKQVFFRNLFSVIGDDASYWKSWVPLQALITCDAYDNYVVIVPSVIPQTVSYVVTHGLLVLARLAGKLSGLAPWYQEYTPEELREVAVRVSRGGVSDQKNR